MISSDAFVHIVVVLLWIPVGWIGFAAMGGKATPCEQRTLAIIAAILVVIASFGDYSKVIY